VDLKHLLKRGALLAAANWQTVAIQFVAETTFQVLLAVPIVGAAVLVAVLLGGDLAEILHGSLRDIFTTVAANAEAGPIEQHPLTIDMLRHASRFTLTRFTDGCARLFRQYLTLGLALIIVYAVSAGGYLTFVVYGYRAAEGRALIIGWTFVAALSAAMLVAWMTIVNMLYLLLQISMAVEGIGVADACRATARFIRSEFRDLVGVFLVVVALVIAATLASALAWSGVGLIAFVPLVGLAVFPLQLAALVLRGLAFEYLGLTALGAYLTLYQGYASRRGEMVSRARADHGRGGGVVGVTGAI
jgi:hypothetical protein